MVFKLSHYKVQSIEVVKRCVMNNLGIAVVPSYSVVEELKKVRWC